MVFAFWLSEVFGSKHFPLSRQTFLRLRFWGVFYWLRKSKMRKSTHDQKVVESKNIGLDIDLGQKVKSAPQKINPKFWSRQLFKISVMFFDQGGFLIFKTTFWRLNFPRSRWRFNHTFYFSVISIWLFKTTIGCFLRLSCFSFSRPFSSILIDLLKFSSAFYFFDQDF